MFQKDSADSVVLTGGDVTARLPSPGDVWQSLECGLSEWGTYYHHIAGRDSAASGRTRTQPTSHRTHPHYKLLLSGTQAEKARIQLRVRMKCRMGRSEWRLGGWIGVSCSRLGERGPSYVWQWWT